jgi:hypothetical protein
MVELLLNGTWTDMTARTYLRDPIRITRGRQDQGARVDPGSCTLTLNNKGGYFSPRNPLSPLYGLIGRNTPVRVSAAGGAPWLGLPKIATGVQATTPDAAALHITGDLDVRADIQPDDWSSPTTTQVAGRWGAPGNRSWRLLVNQGFVQFAWTADGSTALSNAVALGTAAITPRMCVRVTLDVDNGASGRTVRFYTSTTLTGPWTQLGSDLVTAGTTAVFAGTAPLVIGDPAPSTSIRLYGAQVRNGIDGTAVANPDFTAQAVGATGFTDSAGRTYTVTAGGITNRHVRFLGEISAWPARWDVSGGDVYVPVQAAGITRRLGQGVSPLDSTLRRRITSWPTTVAYWPMEDGNGATQAYSPIAGVTPAAVPGAQMASDDTLGGSLPLPVWPQGSRFMCSAPTYAAATSWQVQCVFRVDTSPATQTNLLVIQTTGTIRRWELAIATSSMRVRGYDASDNLIVDSPFAVTDAAGPWTRLRFSASTSGGTVTWSMQLLPVGGSAGSGTGTLSGTSGQVNDVHNTFIVGLSNLRIGHVTIFSDSAATAFDSADTGFDGEGAAVRYVRLASEEGVPFTTPYGIVNTTSMGPQKPGTFLDLLEEAADADFGIAYEARDSIALAYRTRKSLENQAPTLALDYATRGEVAPPLEPVEDDTATRNDVTIGRPSGSAARLTLDTGALSTLPPPSGVGRYATSETRNVQADGQLPNIAGWLLHLGTWDEARFPAVTVNLAAGPWLAGDATTVDLGDLITISNPPPWLPPDTISLMVQGYTETIGVYDWTLTYNCTPGRPWTVGIRDDVVLGRRDTAGSTLATAVNATATTLSVATATGPLWTTSAADYPFDLLLGGEVVTVTACTGSSSPQSMTVTRGTNGVAKAQAVNTPVALAQPTTRAL